MARVLASGSVWSRRALVFCGGRGKWAGNHRGIKEMRADLVFRGAHQECAHNPKKISGLGAELVFREVPGKSVQRGWHPQWSRQPFLGLALLDAVRRRIIWIGGAPPRLSFPPPCGLAFGLVAGVLTVSDTRIRPEPPAADRARPLPGLGHRDSSSPCPLAHRRGSVQAAWVSLGKQRRVILGERRRTVYADPNKLVLKAYSWEGDQLDGFQLKKKNGRGVSSEFPKPAAAGASAGE
jgi:hypothetical protein